jgi:glucan 1,3-beta-glucosidase
MKCTLPVIAVVTLLFSASSALGLQVPIRPSEELVGTGSGSSSSSSNGGNGTVYVVRRNVKDFGAVGDGVTDDTAAFVRALTWDKATKYVKDKPWNYSQYNCQTTKPSIVVVPRGRYLINAILPLTFYTQLVGESETDRPTLLCNGSDYHCLDAGIDEGPGNGWYGNVNQNNFYHQVRNLVVDLSTCSKCVGLHWEVSQATNVVNVHFELGAWDSENIGILMECGSGGYLGDVSTRGGRNGLRVGNQQFTFKNISVEDAHEAAIFLFWNWIMTFVDVRIRNATIGVHATGGVGSLNLVDIQMTDIHEVGLLMDSNTTNALLDNAVFDPSSVALCISVFPGNANYSYTLNDTEQAQFWFQGRVADGSWVQGAGNFPPRAPALLRPDGSGRYLVKMRPDFNATGTAYTFVAPNASDITEKLKAFIAHVAATENPDGSGKGGAIFIPYGVYYLSDTVTIPPGVSLYGEVWTRLLATGRLFRDAFRPHVMLRIGEPGAIGKTQLADLMFSTDGPAPGAIMLQWNTRPDGELGQPGDCGAWDVHYRIGGFAGSQLPPTVCTPEVTASSTPECFGAHTLFELTETGSVYLENCWGWVADHDIDAGNDLNIFSARGFYSKSQNGPAWLLGTAMEHSFMFQYFLQNVSNHFLGVIQTETPYYQPQFLLAPQASRSSDPTYDKGQMHAYALAVAEDDGAHDLVIYGTGLYSFFHNWTTLSCGGSTYGVLPPCQQVLIRLDGIPARSGAPIWAKNGTRLMNINTHGASTVMLLNGQNVSAAESLNGFCQTNSDW